MQNHNGRHYLVVGASSGIGKSISLELANQGAKITMVARNTEKMEHILSAMEPAVGHSFYSFDVTKTSEISDLVTKIFAERGRVDGFVYSAGVGDTMRLRDMTYERLHRVMLVNFYAFIEFTRCLVGKKSRKNTLKIVALSSLASVGSDKYFTAYSASKASVDAAVRCLSKELISKNVTINSVRPAIVDVERLRSVLDDFTEGGLNQEIVRNGYQPLGLIPPKKVAEVVAFLLSKDADYMTGVGVCINGGAAC